MIEKLIEQLRHRLSDKKTTGKQYITYIQGGRGHWTVHYTSPQSFIVKFSYLSAGQLWGLLLSLLVDLFIQLSVQTFQPLIVIYRTGSFVHHHWGCTSIYWPLSYPFRSWLTFGVVTIQSTWMIVRLVVFH